MGYLSVSARPGDLRESPVNEPGKDKGFSAGMPNGSLLYLTFDKETALQWAAALSEAYKEEGK